MTLPSIRGIALLALAPLSAMTVACGDGFLPPGTIPGYYRLESVNGQPLPYTPAPSLGFVFPPIRRGDLLLRPDGTFLQGWGLWPTEGTYRFTGRELVLQFGGGGPPQDPAVGTVSGDSISMIVAGPNDASLRLTFRRGQPNTSLADLYRLTSVNGRTGDPIVASDTVIGGTRHVERVLFDTLAFVDGVFVRRHRAIDSRAYLPNGDLIVGSEEWTVWGGLDSGPGWVRLDYYSPPNLATPARDSLSAAGDTLVRRTPLVTGIRDERYTSR